MHRHVFIHPQAIRRVLALHNRVYIIELKAILLQSPQRDYFFYLDYMYFFGEDK